MSITVGEICAGYGGIGLGLGMLGETRITVCGDQCGGTIIIPAGTEHLVTIRDLDEMELPC